MSDTCSPIENHKFTPSDKVILDTNIWFYLYGPGYRADHPLVTMYSKALHRLLSSKARPYVDQLILSEFVNQYARQEFNYQKVGGVEDFKDYRRSAEFDGVAKAIRTFLKKIVSMSVLVNDSFSTIDFDTLLDDFVSLKPDFNDMIIAQTCKAGGFTIMTHDADFSALGVPVLTGNKKLLQELGT